MPNKNNRHFLEVYLGILSAFAPFVMDMYLASLPELAEYYATSAANVQISLAACVIGLAFGQLAFGPISDCVGRKKPVVISLIAYLAVTAGCIAAPNIKLFVTLRFMQGVTASGGVVITRSIVADCYSGVELSRMYGIVGTINSAATVAAPFVGGFLAVMWGWKGVFWSLFLVGVMMLPCAMHFRETHARENRVTVSPKVLGRTFKSLLCSRDFLVPCLCYAMLMSLIIVNLSSSPFIISQMGMSEMHISLALGANAIALAVTALLSSRVANQRGVLRLSAIVVAVGVVVIVVSLCFFPVFWLYESGVMIMYLGLGCLNTATVTLAMASGSLHTGSASSLLGVMGYLAGAVATLLESLANPIASTPWLFVALAVITLALTMRAKK